MIVYVLAAQFGTGNRDLLQPLLFMLGAAVVVAIIEEFHCVFKRNLCDR